MVAEPPDTGASICEGDAETTQPEACVTVIVRPAIVTVPVRGELDAATENRASCVPVADVVSIVIQGTPLDAVQGH